MSNSSRPWPLGQRFGLKHRLCMCSSHVFTNPEFSTFNRFFKQKCIFDTVQLRTVMRTQGLFSQLSKIGSLSRLSALQFQKTNSLCLCQEIFLQKKMSTFRPLLFQGFVQCSRGGLSPFLIFVPIYPYVRVLQ